MISLVNYICIYICQFYKIEMAVAYSSRPMLQKTYKIVCFKYNMLHSIFINFSLKKNNYFQILLEIGDNYSLLYLGLWISA